MDAATLQRMIAIREDASGMFFATCEEEPTFFVAQTTRDALDRIYPIALERAIREHHQRDMTVVRREVVGQTSVKVELFPRAMLEQQLAAR